MSYVHPTAEIDDDVEIGDNTRIWAHVHVRAGARIGAECSFGRNSFVDIGVSVGDRVKVQNNACLYEGVSLDDGVFVGPAVVFTNDKVPRAVTPGGRVKGTDDWTLGRTRVGAGAAIGANAVIVTGIEIGPWAMIGSGTVVTGDVPAHALVVGNPGRVVGWVSADGVRCESQQDARDRTAREEATEQTATEAGGVS